VARDADSGRLERNGNAVDKNHLIKLALRGFGAFKPGGICECQREFMRDMVSDGRYIAARASRQRYQPAVAAA